MPSHEGTHRPRRSTSKRSTASRTKKNYKPDCPFCEIAAAYPSRLTPLIRYDVPSPTSKSPSRSFPIISTPQVLAFLDIMPLTPGHVLLIPRHHAKKIMDLTPEEGAALGAWLPVLTRAVSRAMQVDDLNVVQNNGDSSRGVSVVSKAVGGLKDVLFRTDLGERASQVVPHVHYHIIPRPESYTPSRSWTMFGKGPREDIDDDEAILIAARIRQEIAWELETRGNWEDAVIETDLNVPKPKL